MISPGAAEDDMPSFYCAILKPAEEDENLLVCAELQAERNSGIFPDGYGDLFREFFSE